MHHTSWSAAEGAPTGVTAIAQTPDGWLWIGGSAGLFRFDGVRFERAPAPIAPLSTNIKRLGVLADGALWITYQFGGASLLQGGTIRHFRAGEQGMPPGTSDALGQDATGRIWLGMAAGIRFLGQDGTWHQPDQGLAAPVGAVTAMLLDRRGTFWVRTRDAVFALGKGSARFERRLAVSGSGRLAEQADGSIWTSDMMGNGLYLVEGAAGTDAHAWRSDDSINDFMFDRTGALWLPGNSGITVDWPANRAQRQQTGRKNGLSGSHGFAVFEDSEDNIWVGTENGVDRFRRYRVHAIALPSYIAGARPLAANPRGGVWIDRSFVAQPDAPPEPIAPRTSDADLTTALHVTPDGVLWSGGIGGLWRHRDGAREAVPLPPGITDARRTVIYSLASRPDGELWVSMGRRGLYALRDGQWSAHGGIDGLAKFAPTVMAGDAQGRLWFGSTGDQVAVLEENKVRRLGRDDGLGLGTVLAILPSGPGAWIGGENGLAYYDGKRFTGITGHGGETFAGTTGLVFATDGALWLNGSAGISSIGPDELWKAMHQAGYRARFGRIDYRDGLPGTASGITPLPSAIRSADGVLWFSTMAGTVGFDPRTLARNPGAPPVYITKVNADGKELAPRDGMQLAPDTGTLEIDFTALSYRAPERMRFRYRLIGVDPDWQEPDNRRSARYTNLPPGRYRFVVAASNDDGVWNERGAALSFELTPSLTQSTWFRVLCAVILAAGLWLLHRMRLRHAAHRMAVKMNERFAERERIARELHDTLLQSVHGLILKVSVAVQRLGGEERASLETALDDAQAVLEEGRDRVAGLRGERLTNADLAAAIAEIGTSLSRDSGVSFEMIVEGAPVSLEPAVSDEVFAIAREAIRNAFVHSQAKAVTVSMRYRRSGLVLEMSDDGTGIAPDVLKSGGRPGHWGIPGMRERAAGIGTLDLVSSSSSGTTWRLNVAC